MSGAIWPFWLGGLAVGLFVVLLAWMLGKGLGVSSGYGTACSALSGLPAFRQAPFSERWRLWFVIGIPLGGLVSASLAGAAAPTFHLPSFEATFGASPAVKAVVLFAGGALVGYGARLSGG